MHIVILQVQSLPFPIFFIVAFLGFVDDAHTQEGPPSLAFLNRLDIVDDFLRYLKVCCPAVVKMVFCFPCVTFYLYLPPPPPVITVILAISTGGAGEPARHYCGLLPGPD
jgi:hypothetical protein